MSEDGEAKEGYSEEGYFFHEFMDLGFDPLEALSLVWEGLSPSGLREFVRHNDCDPRTAAQILL